LKRPKAFNLPGLLFYSGSIKEPFLTIKEKKEKWGARSSGRLEVIIGGFRGSRSQGFKGVVRQRRPGRP
jgi:hypothetical protein